MAINFVNSNCMNSYKNSKKSLEKLCHIDIVLICNKFIFEKKMERNSLLIIVETFNEIMVSALC